MSKDKYTEKKLMQLVGYLPYVRGGNTKPQEIKLLADCYIELLQDCWVKIYSPQKATPPTPTAFMLNGVTVLPVTDTNSTITNWDDILKQFGKLFVDSNPMSPLGGYMQLDIGPWKYAVPLPRTSCFTKIPDAHAAPLTPPISPESHRAEEPPCLCSSRSLVTIGHEQGCRWLLWKNMGGRK